MIKFAGMKSLLTLVLFAAISSFNYSSGQIQDSLWSVWNDQSQEDTTRIDALYDYTWANYMFQKPDSAKIFGRIQLDFSKNLDDIPRKIAAIYTYAGSFLLLSENDSAIVYLDEIYKLAQKEGDSRWVVKSAKALGGLYYRQAKFHLAEQYFVKAIESVDSSVNQIALLSLYSNLGSTYAVQGKNEKAMEQFVLSRDLSVEKGERDQESQALINIANLQGDMGNKKDSELNYLRALKIRKELGNERNMIFPYANLGSMYKDEGRYSAAKEMLLKAYNLALKYQVYYSAASTSNSLAGVYRKLGQIDSAMIRYNFTIETCKRTEDQLFLATAYWNVGTLYRDLSSYDTAFIYLDSALVTARETKHLDILKSINRSTYVTHRAVGQIDEASSFINDLMAIRDVEFDYNFGFLTEEEKELYFATMHYDLNIFSGFTLDYGDQNPDLIAKSYDYSLRTKGMLLKSSTAMRNAILSSNDQGLLNDYDNWISLQKEIAENYADGVNSDELKQEAKQLESRLVKGSKEFSNYDQVQKIRWRDIRNSLGENEVAIEFIHFKHVLDFTDDSAYSPTIYSALIIKKDSEHPEIIKLFDEKELIAILGDFPGNNLAYIKKVYGSTESPKTHLYDLIWKPMQAELEGVKKIYLSPVGLLHKISFPAISLEDGNYLCDQYELETLSSTAKIVLGDSFEIDKQSHLMMIGGVNYNSDSTVKEIWSYLEGSKSETDDIYKIMSKKGRSVNYFSGQEASEEIFKNLAPENNILHIATHGFFYADPDEIDKKKVEEDESGDIAFRGGSDGFGVESFVMNKNPLMRSGIVLAGANDVWNRSKIEGEEDGVLTAQEVANIDLRNVGLVVLSACETGLGDIKGSEGVYGLQRSFKMAGVKFLIMSLWEVPDKETAEFMTTFYKKLSKNQEVKAAFRDTQNEMRNKYDPYFWAAFVLIE